MTHFGSIPCLRLRGDARARGLAYGRGAADLIAMALGIYREYFRRFAGVDWAMASSVASGVWGFLQANVPEIAAEIAAIAEGSGQEVLDIVALNARTEIAYGLMAHAGAKPDEMPDEEGCTSLAVLPEHTGWRGVLAGQNWDWLAACMPVRVALHVEMEDGRELLTFCEAGQVGKIGVNKAGLVVCLNLLSSQADGTAGMPVHILCRMALEQRGLSDVLRVITQWPRAASSNLLVAQSYGGGGGDCGVDGCDGEALDIEFSPAGYGVLEAENGLLAHTNHFLTDCGAPDRGLTRPGAKSTFVRLARARRRLRLLERSRAAGAAPMGAAGATGTMGAAPGGGITPEDLMSVLADHLDHPYSICRHMPPAPDEAGQTDLAFLADPAGGQIWVSDGPPCGEGRQRPAWVRYRLPWA